MIYPKTAAGGRPKTVALLFLFRAAAPKQCFYFPSPREARYSTGVLPVIFLKLLEKCATSL